MLSFLKRSRRDDIQDSVDANRVLLDEFVALDQPRQDEAAEKLAVLWHCFVEVFGSPDKFHGEPRTVQDDYIAKFERVAARSEHVKHEEKGHLHYSVALMLQFLVAARDNDRRQSALDLSAFVADRINRARERQLETTRSQLVDALSRTLENASEPVSTEVMVDHSLEFQEAGDDADHADRDRIVKLHQDFQGRR
jgi:hypothetical protein